MSEVASPPQEDTGPRAPGAPVVVVGIGHDGWDGLAPTACAEVKRADVLMGSPHHLDMVPTDGAGHGTRRRSNPCRSCSTTTPAEQSWCWPRVTRCTRPA